MTSTTPFAAQPVSTPEGVIPFSCHLRRLTAAYQSRVVVFDVFLEKTIIEQLKSHREARFSDVRFKILPVPQSVGFACSAVGVFCGNSNEFANYPAMLNHAGSFLTSFGGPHNFGAVPTFLCDFAGLGIHPSIKTAPIDGSDRLRIAFYMTVCDSEGGTVPDVLKDNKPNPAPICDLIASGNIHIQGRTVI